MMHKRLSARQLLRAQRQEAESLIRVLADYETALLLVQLLHQAQGAPLPAHQQAIVDANIGGIPRQLRDLREIRDGLAARARA